MDAVSFSPDSSHAADAAAVSQSVLREPADGCGTESSSVTSSIPVVAPYSDCEAFDFLSAPYENAPYAKSVADMEALDDDAKDAVSDWLVVQSGNRAKACANAEDFIHTQSLEAVAMLALDMALFPKKDWNAALRARDINPADITSKHPTAIAVAAAFGCNQAAEDSEVRKKATNDIDRFALPVEWLRDKILAMPAIERQAITFDRDGIRSLVQIIKDSGGMNAVAQVQRDLNKTPAAERGDKIEIDPEEARQLLIRGGKAAICAQAGVSNEAEDEIKVVVSVEIGGRQIPVNLEPKVIESFKDKVFEAAVAADPKVDALGELLQVGKLVEERPTGIPANRLDDPKDSGTTMRLATRHFVLRSDKTVLISPILAEGLAVTAVVAKPKHLDIFPEGDQLWELETRMRRKAEANIADPKRRKFFKLDHGSFEGTQGVDRLVITTAAAYDEKARSEDVGILVQPLRSAEGNLPVDVTSVPFKEEITFVLTTATFYSIARALPSRAKTAAKAKSGKSKSAAVAKLTVGQNKGALELGLKNIPFDAQDLSKSGSVRLLGEHVLAIFHTVAELPLSGDVCIAVDPSGAVRFSFSTELAEYDAYAPALTKDSNQPSNRYFAVIKAN